MTVTTTLDRQYFDGDGSNKVFPFNFRFFTNDQIYVSLIAPDGTITPQSLTTNYTLAGALQAGGGTVTMIVAPPFTMPATRVFIQRILPQVQPTSIRNQGKFYPEIHEDAFDRLTMLIQQALAGVGNSLQLTFGKTGWNFLGYKGINVGAPTQPNDAATKEYVDSSSQGNNSYTDSQILRTVRGGAGEVLTQLPASASRANKVMGFDASGNPLAILPASGSGTEVAIDLANDADPNKGLGMVGRKRWNDLWSSIGVGKITGQSILDSMPVNLWEFAYLVTVKPDASNPSTWDWTPAAQEGIYKSNLLRKRLYCPPGDYLITSTLLVPVTAVTNIYSDNNYFNADVIAATYRAPMRFVCDIPSGPLFKTTDGTRGRLNLQGICAANISTVNPDCRVLDFELYGSLVTENFFHSFHGITKGGIGFITQIKNNVGMNIRKTMFEGSFVDSFIDTNYLSMSVETVGVETAIFRGSVGLSNFTNNFCEFAVKGLVSSALTNAEIYGNTFDYMAAPIDIAGVSGSIVSLNKFTHCTKYYANRLALAADDPLRANNWISIKVGNTAKGLTMVGNVGSRIDILGSFRSGGYSDFVTMGNVVEPVADRGANILWDVATADIDKIHLTENDDRVYAVAPSLTGISENQHYGVGNLKFMKLGGSAKLVTCSASKVLATVTASEIIDMSALPLRMPLRLHVVVGSGFSTYSYKIYDIYRDSVVRVFQVSANEENSSAASSTVTVVGSSISINAVGSSASKTMAYNFLIL